MLNHYQMLIDGVPVDGARKLNVINPATGKVIAQAPDCDQAQLDAAVSAARRAFPAWRATPYAERTALLGKAAVIIRENADTLKSLLTSEQGKPHADAFFEVMGASFWLAGMAKLNIPELVNEDGPDRKSITRHVAIGVVGAIAPWNFPVVLSFWKIAPALAAGNTLVMKPSPFTPLTMLKIGELLREIFPKGVLNIVTGSDDLGPWMTSHPGIDKVSFTGSTITGKRVMESAAKHLKRITLELGGNDAAIVMPDVDIEKTAKEIFWAAFRNSGQLCIAAKRIYVHADIYDVFARALVNYAKTVRVGDGSLVGTELGPVQNRLQYERVLNLIEDTKRQGYSILLGGETVSPNDGYFIPVTIVDNPPDHSRIVREEPFGPIVPLLKFDAVDEVIARANDSEYGLAGSVWSADTERALAIASQLETGTVWINEAHYLTPFQPFAGHKQSGFGVENSLDGLLEYTVPQTITVKSGAAKS